MSDETATAEAPPVGENQPLADPRLEEAPPPAEAPKEEQPTDSRSNDAKIIDYLLQLLHYHMPSHADADIVATQVKYIQEKGEPPPADWNPLEKPEEEAPSIPKTELQKAFEAGLSGIAPLTETAKWPENIPAGQVPLVPAPPGPQAGEVGELGVPAETRSEPAVPKPPQSGEEQAEASRGDAPPPQP